MEELKNANITSGERGSRRLSEKFIDKRISRALTGVLRHGANKDGIPYDKHGGVELDFILTLKQFKTANREFIYKLVDKCDKKRFIIYHDDQNIERICASQGHSFPVETYLAIEITEDNITSLDINPDTVVHGTYHSCIQSIEKEGLSKMGRTDIHFGVNVPESGEVISGMRKSCEVIIFIDILAAIRDGYKFTLSNNRVILTPGNEAGFLPPKYISKIVNRS